jgi:hypothetical protein
MIEETVDPYWRRVLALNGLPDFAALWDLRAGWFEPPNERRGGWSGVAKIALELPEGGSVNAFLKRQENHGCRTWRHPLRGVPTFAREFANILRLGACGVPTLEPLYFGMESRGMAGRAILLTRALEGYEALGSGPFAPDSAWNRRPGHRRALIAAVADLARGLHGHGLQHSCLYPKHLMVKAEEGESGLHVDVRLIDLEKLRRPIVPAMAARHDLDAMNRHALGWSGTDRLRFLLAYLGETRLSARGRRLWRYLAARAR